MLTICSWSSNMTCLAEFWSYNWPLALCLNAITHDMVDAGQPRFNPISFTCIAEICGDLDILSMCWCRNTFVIRYMLVAPPMSLWCLCQIHYNSLVYSFSTQTIRFINIFLFTYEFHSSQLKFILQNYINIRKNVLVSLCNLWLCLNHWSDYVSIIIQLLYRN